MYGNMTCVLKCSIHGLSLCVSLSLMWDGHCTFTCCLLEVSSPYASTKLWMLSAPDMAHSAAGLHGAEPLENKSAIEPNMKASVWERSHQNPVSLRRAAVQLAREGYPKALAVATSVKGATAW